MNVGEDGSVVVTDYLEHCRLTLDITSGSGSVGKVMETFQHIYKETTAGEVMQEI